MSREREGGISARIADSVYGQTASEYSRGCMGLRRGQTVAIAGEPGTSAYRVLGIDPMHQTALICRVGSTKESWRLPVAALVPLD